MPDDLRARIAAIQVGHYPWLYDRTLACTCGEYRSEPDLFGLGRWADHLADAVIRELCQEWRIDLGYDGYEFESDRAAAVERLQEIREDWGCDLPPTGVVLQRRYFTEWENDE